LAGGDQTVNEMIAYQLQVWSRETFYSAEPRTKVMKYVVWFCERGKEIEGERERGRVDGECRWWVESCEL